MGPAAVGCKFGFVFLGEAIGLIDVDVGDEL